ncbi:MAG: lipopolysaccharide heptosyltransferase I [Parachlamydiaceae bacterium]|nr:lipopolysaccharide heptosyltransferase I [Parachlamydiaceae bacterium]
MKILIIKTSSLGDIIQTFPVVDYLTQTIPNCEIDWVVEKSFLDLVTAHPKINEVQVIDSKKWRSMWLQKDTWKEINTFRQSLRKKTYDLVLDLQGNIKSGLVTACVKGLRKVGFARKTIPEWPNLLFTNEKYNPPKGKNIREDYLYLAQSSLNIFNSIFERKNKLKLNDHESKKLKINLGIVEKTNVKKVMICPGSMWKNKQLNEESWEQFLKLLSEKENVHYFFSWGNQQEKMIVVGLANKFLSHSTILEKQSIPFLQNMMFEMDLILTMDSLPLHLAGTTPTPTYSVFGSSLANKYKPLGNVQRAYQGTCPYKKKFEKRCAILRTCSTGACMKNLKGDELFHDFYGWWKNLR